MIFSRWMGADQAELYESGALGRLLDVIDPREGEEINVSQRLVLPRELEARIVASRKSIPSSREKPV